MSIINLYSVVENVNQKSGSYGPYNTWPLIVNYTIHKRDKQKAINQKAYILAKSKKMSLGRIMRSMKPIGLGPMRWN